MKNSTGKLRRKKFSGNLFRRDPNGKDGGQRIPGVAYPNDFNDCV